ncbi:hypothetical protein [Prevotella lacticifex]|nr:hypothetical protein [Prevotella lacticifex]
MEKRRGKEKETKRDELRKEKRDWKRGNRERVKGSSNRYQEETIH